MDPYDSLQRKEFRVSELKEFNDYVEDLLELLDETSNSNYTLLNFRQKYFVFNQFTQSLKQTFSNIKYTLLNGNYSNTFVLLRQFRDDFLLYLVILLVGSNRLNDSQSGPTMDEILSDPISAILNYQKEIHKQDNQKEREALNKWFQNEETKQHLGYRLYMDYLSKDKDIKNINNLLDFTSKMKKINETLNGFTHSKGIEYFKSNYTIYYSCEEITALNQEYKKVLLTVLEYLILCLCHINPKLLEYPYDSEEIPLGNAWDFKLDARVFTIINKYSTPEIMHYINQKTDFANPN